MEFKRATPQRSNFLLRLRYRYLPDHLLGALLAKPWIDSSIPVVVLGTILLSFYIVTPDFFTAYSLQSLGRLLGEYAILGIGQAVVVIGGGIDLSVGSLFALCNFIALALIFKFKVNALLVLPVSIALGAAVGCVNGFLIGFLRLRAFLTTLVMLIIIRAVTDMLGTAGGPGLVSDFEINGQAAFDFFGGGTLLGIPSSLAMALGVALVAHVVMTRMRLGWHILAVGGSRRSAYNASIKVRRTVFLTYVISGAMVGLAAYFYAVRLNSPGNSTGVGLELNIILGTVLGGISLGGGRGSIMKALLGAAAVVCINNGLLRLGLAVGGTSIVLGLFLLVTVLFDLYWSQNRLRILDHAYVSPTLVEMPPRPSIERGTRFSQNEQLGGAHKIGRGIIDGPGDTAFDGDGNLITGTSKGEIVKFIGPNFQCHEVMAHTGGRPLGIVVDRNGSLLVCVAGIGLYRVDQNGGVEALAVQTRRSFSIVDDSGIRMANRLDVGADGKIYFSDSTTRYEASEWMNDAVEGRRNGRLLCYDPATRATTTVVSNLVFANGVCVTADKQSLLISETWAACIVRVWIDGPKRGRIQTLIPNLPGYPGSITRASDGNYWAPLVGMRSPAFDLALGVPGFRRHMVGRLGAENWLVPNTNIGCVIKFDDKGRVLASLWDRPNGQFPQIAAAREYKGKLYLSGINNDGIGVIDLPGDHLNGAHSL